MPKFCTVRGATAPIDIAIAIAVDAAGTIDISPRTLTVPSVVCNSPAVIVAASAGSSRVGYEGTVQFGDAVATLRFAGRGSGGSGGISAGASTSRPVNGTLAVTLKPLGEPSEVAANLKPSTIHRDTLRITLSPR